MGATLRAGNPRRLGRAGGGPFLTLTLTLTLILTLILTLTLTLTLSLSLTLTPDLIFSP